MDLIIKQSNTPESVTSELIDRLYNLTKPDPITGQPSVNAVLVGRLEAPSAYEDAVTFLNTQFSSAQDNGSDLRVSVLNNNYYIRFEDPVVEEVLRNSIGKDEGEGITVAEAATLNIGSLLNNNADIESFNEFKFFRKNNTNTEYKINNCGALSSIDLSECTNYPGDNFNNLPNLEYFHGPNSESGVLAFPEGTTTNSSFGDLQKLKHVIFPSTMRRCGGFNSCPNIETVTINPGYETFVGNSFNGSGNGKLIISDLNAFFNITWAPTNSWKNFFHKCPNFFLKDSNGDLTEITSVTIPQTMLAIPGAIFHLCRSLQNVEFHTGIISVGRAAFGWASNLVIQDLNLPNLASLDNESFAGTKIQVISNLGSVTTIPDDCFRNTLLTSVTFPQTLTSIGSFSLYSHVRHTYTFYVSDINNWINCTKDDSFIADEDRYDLYLDNTLVNSISLTGYTTIEQGAFRAMRNAISITLPSTITTIKEYAFFNSNVIINDINLPNLTILERYAFAHNKGTESATINTVSNLGAVTKISDHCFYGCSSLTSITIPNSVTSLGEYAFYGCIGLTSITIPNSITSISAHCFEYCTQLANVIIPNTVTEIKTFAFARTGFTSVTVPSGVTKIEVSAWRYCNNLTSVTISDTVTFIDTCAFCDCPNLRTVVIGSGVQTIGLNVFGPSTDLLSLTCKALTPPTLTRDDSIPQNTTYPIYVPAGSVDAYKAANIWNNHASQIQAIPTT